MATGADPGFFLGGGALVSSSINHIVFFGRIPVVLENCRSSRGRGGEGAHPLHPPPRSAPELSGTMWTQPYSKETSAPDYLRTALFFELSGVTSMCYYCTSSKRSLILQVHVPKTCTCQILLNESETCTVMKAMEKKLDGCYIKMLRMVFNVSWQNKLTNKDYMVICHQCHQRWVSEGWS